MPAGALWQLASQHGAGDFFVWEKEQVGGGGCMFLWEVSRQAASDRRE